MIKFVGAILIVIATSMFGFELAKDILERIKNLKEWHKIVTILEGEIMFNNTILCEAIRKIGIRNQSVYSEFLIGVNEEIEGNKSADIKSVWCKVANDKLRDKYALKLGDLDRIKDFINVVHNINGQNVEKIFKGYVSELDMEINELLNVKESKLKLYKTLGIMSGLFVAVLIL